MPTDQSVTTIDHRSTSPAGPIPQEQWEQHYADGIAFRPLGEDERKLLAEHAPTPADGGRALEVGCGTGELAAHLAAVGYQVDAVDLAETALERARADHPDTGVRWLRLDIEHDDPDPLGDEPYDLVVLRLSVAFLTNRTNTLHALGARLRTGGTLLVITPVADSTPSTKRHIALDESEIAALTSGWKDVQRLDAGDLAVLVLRDPCQDTVAVERSVPATGNNAVAAALAVVTNSRSQVLLGFSARGMWELPGGKIDMLKAADGQLRAESFEQAAVRELREETSLEATGTTTLTVLTDAAQGVPRITAVTRIVEFSGRPTVMEPGKFARFEWFDLGALDCLGPVFAPSAQALNAVWPGTVRRLPPVSSYPHDAPAPSAPGEPPEATRRREMMVQAVIDGGWAPTAEVQAALHAVPRHRYLPEASLAEAYHDDLAVVTRRDGSEKATSSVSAVWLQADMITNARLRPGARVLEIGSGGYNAALLSEVVGPAGQVVTADLDPYVVNRTRRFTAEAGTGNVVAVEGDGALGAPAALVPPGGFDAIIVTYNAWTIAPAWHEQLADGGILVVPLEFHGYTRAVALRREGELLRARAWTYCGFIRDAGALGRTVPEAALANGLRLRFWDGEPGDTTGLDEALRGPRHEVATGATMGANAFFGSLQLYASTTLPGFCRLVALDDPQDGCTGIRKGQDVPAILGDGSLAYLTYIQTRDGDRPEEKEWEWVVYAFGEHGQRLADQITTTVREWDRQVRADDNSKHANPDLTVYPADTPDELLPAGHVLDKEHCRLVFQWAGWATQSQTDLEA
ncbi:methyltransferase, FxLD system [Kitasatospora sp. NPDC001261]|uniref:methyltransferase, FxLD system n=1 Tax=Kitasatospora sp. NPDC001261 TaxID=3364012 RepID=UPI0036C97CA9